VNDGSLEYSQIPSDVAGSYAPGTFTSSLELPGSLTAALTVKPLAFLLLAAEVQYSSLSKADSVPFAWMFPGTWDNALSLRAGVELQFSEFSLRAGMTFDRSPAPDNGVSPSLPTMDAFGYAAGVGYEVDPGLRLDFSYQRFPSHTRSVSGMQHAPSGVQTSVPGLYTMSSTVVGLNITYFWK
jgi:long-chain fatty acid transport protein